MTVAISQSPDVRAFFEKAAGFGSDQGNPRLKQIVLRLLQDSAKLIEDLAISDDEFWTAVDYLNRLGSRSEAGLLVAGLGLEHYLDLLLDAKDAMAVPNVAIEQRDDRHWVQVKQGNDYVAREVKLGVRGTARSQVLSGLKPGEQVRLSQVEVPAPGDDGKDTDKNDADGEDAATDDAEGKSA